MVRKKLQKMFLIIIILLVATPLVLGIFDSQNILPDNSATERRIEIIGFAGEIQCNIQGQWIQDGNILDPQPRCDYISGRTCCPSGDSCVNGECIQEVLPINCDEFNTKTSCEAGNPSNDFIYEILTEQLAEEEIDIEFNDIKNSDFCNELDEDGNENFFSYEIGSNQCKVLKAPCKCRWIQEDLADTSANAPGECGIAYSELEIACSEIDPNDNDAPEDDDLIFREECITNPNPVENRCNTEGIYYYSWTAQLYKVLEGDSNTQPIPLGTTSPSCQNGNYNYQCPSKANLPFFTLANFIITLSFIILIYFILNLSHFNFRRK